MVHGVIIRIASTAERRPAVSADIPRPIMEITATPPVRGASTAIPSIAEARLVPAAAHRPMTTPITAIPMVRGCRTAKRSISVPRRARLAEILAMNMQTTPMRTAMESATIAAQRFR